MRFGPLIGKTGDEIFGPIPTVPQRAPSTGPSRPAGGGGGGTTSQLTDRATRVAQYVEQVQKSATQVGAARAALDSGSLSGSQRDAYNSQFAAGEDGYKFATQALFDLGLDVDGQPLPEDEKSGDGAAWANLSARYAELDLTRKKYEQEHEEFLVSQDNARAENALDRGHKASEGKLDRDSISATSDKNRQETQRGTNIDATLNLLEAQVRRGELQATEAKNKAAAAFDQAEIQRRTLADHAGKNIPAGSQYFPNLGPGGLIGNAVGALLPGSNFSGLQTGGTFAIDPNAMAAPVGAAYNSTGSALPQTDAAFANAAKVLAGLGVSG